MSELSPLFLCIIACSTDGSAKSVGTAVLRLSKWEERALLSLSWDRQNSQVLPNSSGWRYITSSRRSGSSDQRLWIVARGCGSQSSLPAVRLMCAIATVKNTFSCNSSGTNIGVFASTPEKMPRSVRHSSWARLSQAGVCNISGGRQGFAVKTQGFETRGAKYYKPRG